MKNWKRLLLSLFLLSGLSSWGQDRDIEELNLIEMELDKSPVSSEPDESSEAETSRESSPKSSNVTFEDLGKLAEFRQVSVIQKRYLPRTGRFQFFAAPTMTLNDPWFNNYGGSLRLSYNLSETWGLEAGYCFMSKSETQALKELSTNNGVETENFVYTKNNYTLDLNWTPLYGKMTWLDQKILYYDTYFSLGTGGTEIQTGDVQSTLHLGAGQIFSMSKKMAFRWDLSWNFFEAQQIDASDGSFNNVYLSVGFSFFFPEATYR